MKNRIYTVIAILLMLAPLAGCEKGEVNTTITVRPGYTIDSITAWYAVGHAFVATDTAHWSVESFEDALQGVITSKTTSARRNADYTGYVGSDSLIFLGPFTTEEPVMLVVCEKPERYDHENRKWVKGQYAWRNIQAVENLSRISMLILFNRNPTGETYTANKWIVENPNWEEPLPQE